jgi:hypothetical protein
MREFTTDQSKSTKKILLDGHAFTVRQPGAGESLMLQKAGRETKQLQAKKEKSGLSEAEQDRFLELTEEALEIALDWYQPDDKEGKKHLYRLDPVTVIETINEVFGEPEEEDISPDTGGAKEASKAKAKK